MTGRGSERPLPKISNNKKTASSSYAVPGKFEGDLSEMFSIILIFVTSLILVEKCHIFENSLKIKFLI